MCNAKIAWGGEGTMTQLPPRRPGSRTGGVEGTAVSRAAGKIRGVSGKWLSEYLGGNSNEAYLFPLPTDIYLFKIMIIKNFNSVMFPFIPKYDITEFLGHR